jgi:2'-5' RNA ligase
LKTKLKNRGEAHITVVTPPEWKVLSQKLSIEEVHQWALDDKLHRAPYRPVCVGTYKLKDDSTYFVVVESLALLRFRQKLKHEFDQRHGQGDFDPEHFKPHVTLGFTHKDLHEQDGAQKDESSCWLRWK